MRLAGDLWPTSSQLLSAFYSPFKDHAERAEQTRVVVRHDAQLKVARISWQCDALLADLDLVRCGRRCGCGQRLI